MKRIVFFAAVLTALAGVAAAAQSTPNLSGTWTLDAARSSSVGGGRGQRESAGGGRGGGLGLGPAPDQLIVTQDAKAITIGERRGDERSTIVLRLDGQPQTRMFTAGRSAGATAASVTSTKDGRVLTTVTLPTAPAGGAVVRYEESRHIDADGSLVLEITMSGGANSRRVVYRRERQSPHAAERRTNLQHGGP